MITQKGDTVLYYPSIGNSEYPYATWQTMQPEYVWTFLDHVGGAYNNICRTLRNVYHWPPYVVDKIELTRLIKLYEETLEDNSKKTDNEFTNFDME